MPITVAPPNRQSRFDAIVAAAIGLAASAGPACAQTAQGADPAEPVSEAYPAIANGDGTPQGVYNLSRWAEDWRNARPKGTQDDPIDDLKMIALDAAGDSYVTVSGELRARIQQTSNPNLQAGDAQRQERLRLVAGADVHLTRHVRAYGEIAHAGLDGANLGTPNTNLRNDFVVQQAFVEIMGNDFGVNWGLRGGRQEFTDGPNLLTSSRDDNTLRFVLDGVRAYARGGRARIDLFDFRYVRYGYGGAGDDVTDGSRRFSGVTLGFALPSHFLGKSKLFVDPFVWRLRNREAVWRLRTAREERMFYGLHVYGDVGAVTLDWTINHQAGRYGGRPIAAWQGFFAQSYRLGNSATAPRLGVHLDYASGGGSYDGEVLRTPSGLFGNNVYYSYQLFLTPTNLAVFAPNVSFQPVDRVRVTAEYGFAWRPSARDAVYRASGAAFAGTQNASGHRIADVMRLQVVWSALPRLTITGRMEHLVARAALNNAGYSGSSYFAVWASWRF